MIDEPNRKTKSGTNNTDTLLALSNITKNFGGLRAVDKVTLKVDKGTLRCLIGPNGAGKSTIFKLITGFQKQDQGLIEFKNADIAKLKPFERASLGISMKFQTPMLFEDLSVEENLVISTQRIIKDKYDLEESVLSKLKFFNLMEIKSHDVKNISHGHRQWLEIAMALSINPDLLLLDEPVAGMTSEERIKTAQMILELNKEGMTIIVIDHDMDFVRSLNCEITVLNLGKVFAEGSLNEIENHEDVRNIYLGKKKGE